MPAADSMRSDVNDLRNEILVTAAGAATSVAVALLVLAGQLALGIDLSSFSIWLVVPIGAIAAGVVAASGYHFAAVRLEQRPTRLMKINMVLLAVSTFLLIQYLVYRTTTLETGEPIAQYIGFIDYYVESIRHQQLVFRRATASPTPEVGIWGYGLELIRFSGFLLGGLGAFWQLSAKPYCDNCSKYYRSRKLIASEDPARIGEYLDAKGIVLHDVGDRIRQALGSRPLAGLSLELDECPQCHRRQLRLMVKTGDDSIQAGVYELEEPALVL